ncbi:hypothetical protein ACI3PL_27905, partial [Lacticaseibacillus paracasei]
ALQPQHRALLPFAAGPFDTVVAHVMLWEVPPFQDVMLVASAVALRALMAMAAVGTALKLSVDRPIKPAFASPKAILGLPAFV